MDSNKHGFSSADQKLSQLLTDSTEPSGDLQESRSGLRTTN